MAKSVQELPGYRVTLLSTLGMQQSQDGGLVKEKAIKMKAIILTRDADFLDEASFRI